MVNIKFPLAFALLCSTACALNNIWIGTSYPQCDSCLDQTFLSCPGDYHDVGYAQCMCGGDGGVNMNTCVSVCNGVDALGTNLGSQVAGGWYLYCTIFFKEFCPGAKQFMGAELYEKRCGAASGPELADSVAPPTSSAGKTAPATATNLNTPSVTDTLSGTAPTIAPSATSALSGNAASTGDPATRPTNAAALVSNPLPRWGLIIGLGVQLAGIIV